MTFALQTALRRVPKSFGDNQMPVAEGQFVSSKGLEACTASHFSLLLQNLNVLEETFATSDVLKLEKEILLQLGRLGALRLFDICLSRTLKTSSFLDLSDIPTVPVEVGKMERKEDNNISEIIVRSGKKEERSRERTSDNATVSSNSLRLKTIWEGFKKPNLSSGKRASNYRSRRLTISKNEAEMSIGVKVVLIFKGTD